MERLRGILNLKVLIGGFLVTACLLSVLLVFIFNARNEKPVVTSSTAVLYVIAAPSATIPAPAASATPSATPTSTAPQGAPGGELAVGVYAQVTGTGGDGLRLRSEPGLSGTVRFLGIDGEEFEVQDGPQVVDGYTWWFLQAPYDANVQGWAVADYLVVIQNP
jgi:hypothetical protein